MLQVLRPGVQHEQVEIWEEFLLGYGFYNVEVDSFFDQSSVEATKLFQKEHGLRVDGWVGSKTWGKAIELGLDVLRDGEEEKAGPNWPPRPVDLNTLSTDAARMSAWGEFTYEPVGTPNNPEAITITNDWADRNLVSVSLDEVKAIRGVLANGRFEGEGPKTVQVHRFVRESFIELWAEWRKAGLLDRVLTWAGMWNPRFIRGSRTRLSNHAFATAFDLNVAWNGLRRVGALVGERGSVRELVPIANELGWFWGGHFSRKDPMHFEATLQIRYIDSR